MQALPLQKITIICVTNGRRKYQFKYRTDRFYNGLATDMNGPSSSFSLVNSQGTWAFGREVSLPQWLLDREVEVVLLFSIIIPGSRISGYDN